MKENKIASTSFIHKPMQRKTIVSLRCFASLSSRDIKGGERKEKIEKGKQEGKIPPE